MQCTFENKVALWFVAAAVILLSVATFTYRSLTALAADADAVTHSHQVIEGLDRLRTVAQSAEDAQRGYLLTGDVRYRQQYEDARRAIAGDVAQLKPLLLDNPAQAHSLEHLALDIEARIAFLQAVFQHYETEGSRGGQAGQHMLASRAGQQTLDNLTNDIAQMQDVENQRLQVSSARIISGTRRATLAAFSGIGLSFLIMGFVYYLVIHEIGQRQCAETALQGANEQLDALATLDGLTGVKNRRALDARLAEELAQSARYRLPLSVLLLDVDEFKLYNDSFGHQAGDEVLRSLGRLLQEQARATDFVARYGGEEFTLLLPNTDTSSALVMAERLRCAIEAAPWRERAVTASVGVATLDAPPATSATSARATNAQVELIAAADRALYAAKAKGRNCVAHAQHLTNEATHPLQLPGTKSSPSPRVYG